MGVAARRPEIAVAPAPDKRFRKSDRSKARRFLAEKRGPKSARSASTGRRARGSWCRSVARVEGRNARIPVRTAAACNSLPAALDRMEFSGFCSAARSSPTLVAISAGSVPSSRMSGAASTRAPTRCCPSGTSRYISSARTSDVSAERPKRRGRNWRLHPRAQMDALADL